MFLVEWQPHIAHAIVHETYAALVESHGMKASRARLQATGLCSAPLDESALVIAVQQQLDWQEQPPRQSASHPVRRAHARGSDADNSCWPEALLPQGRHALRGDARRMYSRTAGRGYQRCVRVARQRAAEGGNECRGAGNAAAAATVAHHSPKMSRQSAYLPAARDSQ